MRRLLSGRPRARTAAALVAAATTAAVVLVGGTAATAAVPGAVTLPGNLGDRAPIALEGASSAALVAMELQPPQPLLVGAPGGTLDVGPVPSDESVVGLVGGTLWTRFTVVVGGNEVARLHAYDLVAGGAPTTRVIDGYTPVGAGPAGLSLVDQETGALSLLRPDDTRQTLLTPQDGAVFGPGEVVSDGSSVAVAYPTVDDSFVVAVIDLATGGRTTLATSVDPVPVVALTASDVVWVTSSSTDGSLDLHRAPRAGGAGTVRPVAAQGFPVSLAATDAAALVNVVGTGTGRALLVPADGSVPVSDVGLAEVNGVFAVGDGFRAGVGGPLAGAGVWSVDAQGATTRVSAVRAPTVRADSVDLTGTSVYYTDRSDTSAPGAPVWRRSVTGTRNLALGAQSLALPRASESAGLSVSGTRRLSGSVGAPAPGAAPAYDLYDRGVRTGSATFGAGSALDLSGPYAAVGDTVLRVDGTTLLGGDGVVRNVAVYGRRALWTTDLGDVWLQDLEARRSGDNPRRLVVGTCTADLPCPRTLALGPDHAVWDDLNGGLVVIDLRTRKTRAVAAGTFPFSVVMTDGALGWVGFDPDAGVLQGLVLDLSSATSVPVVLAADVERVVLDDHRAAWRTTDGRSQVGPLPFRPKHRPRLLGVVAPRSFRPSAGQVWAPQVDLSKSVTGVSVVVTRGGDVVRTLRGTSVDGSIRDVVWDGRDAKGRVVPAGSYTWTLAASAADGDGTAVDLDGRSRVTGAVTVR